MRRVEFENCSTRPAQIYHKRLSPNEPVGVDRGNALCTLARRQRDLPSGAEQRKAFSLPGGDTGYPAQFTVAVGEGRAIACVVDTSGSASGRRFKIEVHDVELRLTDNASGRTRIFRAEGEVTEEGSDEEDEGRDYELRTALPTLAESRGARAALARAAAPSVSDAAQWEEVLEQLAELRSVAQEGAPWRAPH